ncbi:Protein RMD5-like protein A [Aphelenchoides besseyi]|nr:Protein RMD5-like protein A [Aphelenchoides besseyi]
MAEEIAANSKAALQRLQEFREKWMPLLQKQITKVQTIEHELINVPQETEANAELSVTGQYVMEESLNKLKKLFREMTAEHRQIHSEISKCGKNLDRLFKVELRDLIRNEKELEAHTPYFSKVNRLIFEHLMSLGRAEVAETFMKESELKLKVPPKCDINLMRSIMEPFKRCEYMPAIEWVKENANENKSLLFQLHRQHMLQLLIDRRNMEALMYARNLQQFATIFDSEITALMAVVVSYPNVERHQNLFLKSNWLELEEELASALTNFRSPLSMIMEVGARAIPQLLKYQTLLRKDNEDQVWFGEELPIEVPIPEYVHSTFTCPIMKTQTTEENPPMRLTCGHVISKEALSRLIQTSRSDKLKCPYCPETSSPGDAARVYF